jgi:uncharacterized metal-binding protein
MSNGRTHSIASVALACGFLLSGGGQEAMGALVGVMISPDCDVDNGFVADTYIRNRFGRVVEMGWDGLWYFYRRSLKHGGELSHFPIISTLGRIAYLFFFTIVIPYVVLMLFLPGAWDIQTELGWWWGKIWEHWRLIVGLMGADLIHWGLDISTTEHLERKQNGR